jgi:hypothetical protein
MIQLFCVTLLFMGPIFVDWAPRKPGKAFPAATIRGNREGEPPLFVCRARLQDGVQPGATSGGPCMVPQKGKAVAFDTYELGIASRYAWRAGDWDHAVLAGAQGRANSELYVCRAEVTSGSGHGRMELGKAYRAGPHAGHCYVAHEDREIDAPGEFQLLVVQ